MGLGGDEDEGVDGGGVGVGELTLGAGDGDAVEVVQGALGARVVVPVGELVDGDVQSRGERGDGLGGVEEGLEELGLDFGG